MSATDFVQEVVSWVNRNRRYVLAAALQLALFPFGHWYDTRIFFGTGAGVAHGLSPYWRYDLIDYYNSPSLVGIVSGIGYPPLWALFLAAMYDFAYLPSGSPFVMNLTIKLPIIAGNLVLARFVTARLRSEGCDSATASRAELLVLFNPFLLYTSVFWNMFDTLVALFVLVSLHFLDKDRPLAAGLALGFSIALKHLALPLIPLGWLWIARRPLPREGRVQRLATFTSALLGVAIVFVVLPFYLFGWSVSGFSAAVTYQTMVAGGFTIYNTIPLDLGSLSVLSVLGYLPFIAVIGGYIVLRKRPLKDFRDLTEFALIILIVFMTTRTFLAEQNLALIFPLILFPELLNGRGLRVANRFWMLFLVYTLWNSIPIQFSFLIFPNAFNLAAAITTSFPFGLIRQGFLFGCAVLWLLLGWNYIVRHA
jgi:Gpi18-like mannosyltransferase